MRCVKPHCVCTLPVNYVNARIEANSFVDVRLLRACLSYQLQDVKELIAEDKAEPDCKGEVFFLWAADDTVLGVWRNATPLLIACWAESVEIVTYLLDVGADINYASAAAITLVSPLSEMAFAGWTVLHISTMRNDIDMYKLLKDRGATVTTDEHGLSPLINAAVHKSKEMVLHLVDCSSEYSREEKSDALELLGSKLCCVADTFSTGCELWLSALEERNREPKLCKENLKRYGRIKEIDTPELLSEILKARQGGVIRVQTMLTAERVCGKTSAYVTPVITTLAKLCHHHKFVDEAINLSFRALTNLDGVLTTGKVRAYYDLGTYLEEVLQPEGPAAKLSYNRAVRALNMAFADFRLGTSYQRDDEDKQGFKLRKKLLVAIWRLLALVDKVLNNVPYRYITTFMESVKEVRGKNNQTLLHIACGPDTNELHEAEHVDFKATLRALVTAVDDVDLMDDTGQTPMQLARRHKGPEIIRILHTAYTLHHSE